MASQTTLFDVFDSFAGTVNTVLDIDRKEMERAAEMDILNWQAKFRVESDQFMNDLYRTTDENWSDQYTLAEQWDDRLNQFLSTTRDNLKNANPYMQRQIEQMLTGYEATLRNDLRSKASAKMNEHAVLTMQDTADINRRTLNGQERINANGEVYRQAYMNGTIDETNYRRLMLAETEQTVSDYYTDRVTELTDAALKDGLKSWESIEAEIRADKQSFTNLTGDQVDQDKFRVNALKNGEKLYYARLGELQDKNANSLSEAFLRIISMESASQQYTAARSVLADMDMTMGGNRLDESRRNSYARIFASFVNDFLDEQSRLAAASARASDSGSGTDNSAVQKSIKDYIKAAPATAFSQYFAGDFSSVYGAMEAYSEELKDAFIYEHELGDRDTPINYKEYKGYDAAVSDWAYVYNADVIDGFFAALNDKLKQAGGSFNTVYQKYENIMKDFKNGNLKDYDPAVMGDFFDFVLDTVASTPPDKLGDIEKAMDSWLNAVAYTKQRSKLFFDPKYSSVRYGNDGTYSYSNKEIAEFAKAAAENDIIFTDFYGRERVPRGANVGQDSALVASQMHGVARWLGLENYDGLSWQYEATDNDEKTSIIVGYKGKNYKIEATADGKNYQVFDVTGNKHEAVEDHRGVYEQRRKEKQDAVNAANNAAWEAQLRDEDPEGYDFGKDLESMSEPSAAVNIFMNKMNMGDFKEKWSWDAESYGAADRKWEVRNVAEYIYKNRNNKNQATEYYKALSLLPDDYDSLSQSDKNKAFDNARETFEKIYNDQDEDKVLYFVGSSDPNTWLESRNGSSSQGTATPPPIKPIPTVSKEATAQVSSAASTAWKNTLQEDLAGQDNVPAVITALGTRLKNVETTWKSGKENKLSLVSDADTALKHFISTNTKEEIRKGLEAMGFDCSSDDKLRTAQKQYKEFSDAIRYQLIAGQLTLEQAKEKSTTKFGKK